MFAEIIGFAEKTSCLYVQAETKRVTRSERGVVQEEELMLRYRMMK